MIKKISFILFLGTPFFGNGQTIKTKVQESGYEIKPEAQKVEQFEEARIFLYAGAGFGLRQGKITTGFLVGQGQGQYVDASIVNKTTNKSDPFINGFFSELGFRYFTKSNFGVGVKGSLFLNSGTFLDSSGYDPIKNNSTNPYYAQNAAASTSIFNGNIECIYRYYLSEASKSIFVYGGLGLGMSIINQDQNYSAGRKTRVDNTFFSVRPFVGIQIPVWDIIYVYAETGYNFAQGKISAGTLSLSQYQASAGIQIRLNEF